MAKKNKRQGSSSGGYRTYSKYIQNQLRQDRHTLLERLRSDEFIRRRRAIKKLTRDILPIAKQEESSLSLASEDLRHKQPFKTNSQHRVFHNIDGTPANTRYKEVPVKKKDLIILVGEVFTVLIILLGLWCVAEDMSDGVCSLPTKLLDAVRDAVRSLLGVPNGLSNLI